MTIVRVRVICIAALAVFLVLIGCAPKATPTAAPPAPGTPLATVAAPQPTAAPTTAATTAPQPTAASSTEDVEWNKTVEAAKREGHLTIYSFFLNGDVGQAVTKAFEQKYGIKLEIVTSTDFTERLKTEQRTGQNAAGVYDGGSITLLDAGQGGLAQPVGDIPTLRDSTVWRRNPFIDKDNQILSLAQGTVNPWINTTLVKPGSEPTSWKDLLQPAWKGKIAMADPSINTQPNRIFEPLVAAGRLDEAYFKQLGKQDIQWQPSIRTEGQVLANGQVSLAFAGSLSALAPYIAAGAPIKAIDMNEGVVTYIMGAITMVNKAPQPNAARVYINWFMSQEGQTIFHKANLTYSIRNDVPDFEPPQARLTPKNPVAMTVQDDMKANTIQRADTIKKLMLGN